jgi:hypothetical protein
MSLSFALLQDMLPKDKWLCDRPGMTAGRVLMC